MAAGGAFFLIALVALVTDAGYMYYSQDRLQTAVNAGWKAGYDKMHQLLSTSPSGLNEADRELVRKRVLEVMKQNGYSSSEVSSVTVKIGDRGLLEVISHQPVGLFFAKVMNYSSADVGAARSSADMAGNQPAQIIPLAIPHGVVKDLSKTTYAIDFFASEQQFATNTEYILKLGSGGGGKDKDEPGTGKQKNQYGPIDPDNVNGGGANDYRDRFKSGYSGTLEVSDRILLESGNMEGPTDQAVAYHITGDASASPSRRVIIPITDVPPDVKQNNSQNNSAMSLYDIQGQDHPNGAYRPDKYSFGSSVRIIGFAEFELIDQKEYQRAGSNIQSGDSGDLGNYQSGQVRGRFIKYIIKPGDIAAN